MIEQLVKVLAKVLFNKETGNYRGAISDIKTAFNNILGLDYNLVSSLSAKDIKSLLKMSGDEVMINVKYIVIAKLLKEKSDIENLQDGINSGYEYQRSLDLFLEGILNNKNKEINLSPYYNDVKEIIKRLKDEIPDDIRFKLFKFFTLIGEYDNAAAELFRLNELGYNNINSEGISFFRKLESLNEIELKNGNLSREEVLHGLSIFSHEEK